MYTDTLSPINKATYHLLNTVGRSSDSIRLGLRCGFDSGEMMDRIYANRPSGRFGIGWVCDWLYLNQIGCKGLRGRKALLKGVLRHTLASQHRQGTRPVIVDIASGPANYLVETLSEVRIPEVQAIARDLDRGGLCRGESLARSLGVSNIRYQHADALDAASLSALDPAPTLMVSSGFYEILNDDGLVRRSMGLVRQSLPDGGVFIFTTQFNHPQVELIKALPNRAGESWVMKNRSIREVETWARAAGFSQVQTTIEPYGLFSVSVAR
jgi:hypothetical protein